VAVVAAVTVLVLVIVGLAIALVVASQPDDEGLDAEKSSRTSSSGATSEVPSSASTTEPVDDAWATDGPSVQDAAGEFVRVLETYGPGDLDADGRLSAYRDAVGALVTPALSARFLETVPLTEKSTFSSGIGRSATVDGTGVEALSADGATVLVAATVTQTRTGSGKGGGHADAPTAVRLEVTLARVDGAWLVDDFAQVTGSSGATGAPGGSLVPAAGRDAEARAEEGVEAVLSYDYRTLADDEARATAYLTDDYAKVFGKTFDAVRAQAPQARAVNRIDVVVSGVTTVTEDEVSVLLFADQSSRNRTGRQTSQARVVVTMRLVDGEWYLADLQTR
jgi:hypothetical protein